MTTYYIFRHGQTYFSKNEVPYGSQIENAPLLPEGKPIIRKLAEYLKSKPTDANFTSPYLRCVKTSNIVSKITGKVFTIDNRLHDFNAESIDTMVKRLKDFLDEVAKANYESVTICTHGYPIAVLKGLLTKGKCKIADLQHYPPTGTLLVVHTNSSELLDFNK